MKGRRVVAIQLPDLLCELAGSDKTDLLGVIEAPPGMKPHEASSAALPRAVLVAVNEAAHRYGVRAGQTVAEARALASMLAVRAVSTDSVTEALGRVAEIALGFSPCVALELGHAPSWRDTVWLDVSGSAHLLGGEEPMLSEIALRVSTVGHRARVAAADGPLLARSAAVYGVARETIVPVGQGKAFIQGLPVDALPVPAETVTWLARLGVWNVGDVAKLPSRAAQARLGDRAALAIALASGVDDTPLSMYEPPRAPSERTSWEEPVFSVAPLLFALRGLVARLSARLEGRGEAARTLEVFAPYDRSIAELSGRSEPGLELRIELPSPLAREEDLFRVLKSKIERQELHAPVKGLAVTASLLTRAPRTQLELGGDVSSASNPKAFAVLLAELSAEVGKDRVGVFTLVREHAPESKTGLVPLETHDWPEPREPEAIDEIDPVPLAQYPTRLLPRPVPLEERPKPGDTLAIGRQWFVVHAIGEPTRVDQVKWWTTSPVCRDYARVSLVAEGRVVEAWIFTDRVSQRTYLHGYYD